MTSNTDSTAAKTAMLFGVAGFLAGILLAPKSGKESRQDLANKTKDLKDRMSSTKGQIKDMAHDTAEDIKSTTKKTIRRAKDISTKNSDDMNEDSEGMEFSSQGSTNR